MRTWLVRILLGGLRLLGQLLSDKEKGSGVISCSPPAAHTTASAPRGDCAPDRRGLLQRDLDDAA